MTIDFAVLIPGTEKPAVEDTPLRTEYAHQVFQKLYPHISAEVERFFLRRLNKSFSTHRFHVARLVV